MMTVYGLHPSEYLPWLAGGEVMATERANLLRVADLYDDVERIACDRRKSIETQTRLRVEAQARAGRLAKDSRR